jgi:transketolase
MVALEGFGYLGQALSSAELASVLYLAALRAGYDRLVVSPGHYSIVHFAAGVEVGLIDEAELSTYGKDGSRLEAIGTEDTPGLAATCGSLGQGLSVAAGIALAQQLATSDRHVYVLMSDGEMEEGQVWEAAMFCAHHRLGNLTVVLDRNNSQVDGPTDTVTTLEPVVDKWRAFGWAAAEVDGHDVVAIGEALRSLGKDPRRHDLDAVGPGQRASRRGGRTLPETHAGGHRGGQEGLSGLRGRGSAHPHPAVDMTTPPADASTTVTVSRGVGRA